MASIPQSLPVLYVVGTHYDVGYSIGRTFADKIKSFWKESVDVNEIDIPFHKTPEGKKFFDSSLKVCQENFPQYVKEIQGMADGSGIPFDNLFILNISKEVHNVLSSKSKAAKESAGCTDVFINTPTCKILAHNEDCDPMVQPHGYIVSARIVSDVNGEELENVTAFCYPGVLAGTTLSFNKHGLVFTIDGLYANYIVENAPSRMFLNRSIIKARSLEEAKELIANKGFGVAYGFTVNIVDIRSPTNMWSVEIGPQAGESLYHVHKVPEEPDAIKPCHYIHINNMKHLKIPEIPNLRSSVARTKRAEEHPPPKTLDDVMTILGDVSNQQYPIFRSPRPTDNSATVFTGVINVLKNRLDIYRENPAKKGILPLLTFNILDQ